MNPIKPDPQAQEASADTPKASRQVLILSDDFTGACEVSLPWVTQGYQTAISLDQRQATPAAVQVLDLNTRYSGSASAEKKVEAIARAASENTLLVKKIDSLWRGNIKAELGALANAGYKLVIAGALPHLNRTVLHGSPLIGGFPLGQTETWSIERNQAPRQIEDLLTNITSQRLARPTAATYAWKTALNKSLSEAQAIIVDCESDEDLTRIACAVLGLESARNPSDSRIALVGTGALNAAAAAEFSKHFRARELAAEGPAGLSPIEQSARPILGIVGSASGRSGEQLAAFRKLGHHTSEIADEVIGNLSQSQFSILSGPATLGDPSMILNNLKLQAQKILACAPNADLFLTGGETARTILDDLGISTLEPLLQLEPGVVICRSTDGRLIGTKPGTFGSTHILNNALKTLRTLRTSESQEQLNVNTISQDQRPYIAVTMGDGAGVGPEVTVGALLDERAYGSCRPVVIGDTRRLRLGAEALGAKADIVEITDISEAEFVAGRINVIDPHLLSEDLPWGEESAEAGNAAYHYIRIACELGMAGEVQGICTAPLNKAALHSAGHIYPGHTELLAHFMGVEEVSMMLSTPKVKVIHVTTHVGLIDAITKIEPGLVERTVRRGHDALVRAGNPDPKIGVCAINPHAGENGLFGYGEEETKIVPALEKLRADGIDAVGPLPADTAFFLAGRGDYDLIVAMYHDQGHGPVKVLGIEAGVNITVGLPVIRTSVDHGTAFDIAGKGIVEVGSMIEALAQSVALAAVPVR
ncbi:4-hydroxythreonine-4-phosphate dehydrogenase PdxA [Arthrobacter sp. MYb229]|uniref:4-hydroxythreonine-4-phosphate dehydrogenase PdxA n=1 Tax=unclassified Arthrobacter TaxID=235627 RepID=UPI000CFDEF94|nr:MULTISPECIES: 4-hydroxythreonine-4-phosphate dehydrogenase PdxA [unclassified Arthrobacter]PRA04408.1 4-hydroxythreonine-4-phosphate dehydrogenase PdxA [Arthrobacter sp. MYb229]PRB51678.1 4-hydroxythreonine-4-phosphate dehydrogenase PdxA [Arthrobacter sp. MYb216]